MSPNRSNNPKARWRWWKFVGKWSAHGLVIALVVFGLQDCADRLKTERERQTHDRDLEFERAKTVQQLLPTLYDDKQSTVVRAEILAHLLETDSITDQIALRVTEQLYDEARNSQIDSSRVDSSKDVRELLLEIWLRRMPLSFGALLDYQGQVRLAKYNYEEHRESEPSFSSSLFVRCISATPDYKLGLLDDDEFLGDHLWAMEKLLEDGEVLDLPGSLSDRGSKGLRILGAIRTLRLGYGEIQKQQKYLLEVIDPARPTPARIVLSGSVSKLLSVEFLLYRSIAERFVQIAGRWRKVEDYTSLESRIRIEAITYPLQYAGNAARDGGDNDLQAAFVSGLEEQLADLDEQSAVRYNSEGDPIVNTTFRDMLQSLLYDLGAHPPSDAAVDLLRAVAAMSDDRLEALDVKRGAIDELLKKVGPNASSVGVEHAGSSGWQPSVDHRRGPVR